MTNPGLLHYGDYSAGLLKSAEMEKQAWLPVLIGIGKAIGWGLTAYGGYRAAKYNAPQLVDHIGKGEIFSSPVTEEDPMGLGAAGEVVEGALNVLPAAGAGKLAIQGAGKGKNVLQSTNQMWRSGTPGGFGTGKTPLWGPAGTLQHNWNNDQSGGMVPDSQFNTTDPYANGSTVPDQNLYDPYYKAPVPQLSGPGTTPPGGSPGGFGFKLDGNASSNQKRVR